MLDLERIRLPRERIRCGERHEGGCEARAEYVFGQGRYTSPLLPLCGIHAKLYRRSFLRRIEGGGLGQP